MDKNTEIEFINDDLNCTAFILSNSGITLLEIKEDRPSHFIFVLSNPSKCAQLKQEFLNNAPVPVRQLLSIREMLISEIKSRKEIGG